MELNPDNGMRAIVKYWAPEYRERFGSHDFMLMSIHTNYSYLQLSTRGSHVRMIVMKTKWLLILLLAS